VTNLDRFKYKAWDIQENCFMENVNEAYNNNIRQLYITANGNIAIRTMGAMTIEPDRYIHVPCTGEKDKNDKLIYESDVIDEKYNAIVIFWRAGFWVDHKHGKVRKKTPLTDWLDLREKAGIGSEVIGNIRKNPELLKV